MVLLLKMGANYLAVNKEGKKPVNVAVNRVVVKILEGNCLHLVDYERL